MILSDDDLIKIQENLKKLIETDINDQAIGAIINDLEKINEILKELNIRITKGKFQAFLKANKEATALKKFIYFLLAITKYYLAQATTVPQQDISKETDLKRLEEIVRTKILTSNFHVLTSNFLEEQNILYEKIHGSDLDKEDLINTKELIVATTLITISVSSFLLLSGTLVVASAAILSFATMVVAAPLLFGAAYLFWSKAKESQERVTALNQKLSELEALQANEDGNAEKKEALNHLISLEKANTQSLRKATGLFTAFGTLLIGVAIVAAITAASLLSAGIIPIIVCVSLTAAAFILRNPNTQDDIKKVRQDDLKKRLDAIHPERSMSSQNSLAAQPLPAQDNDTQEPPTQSSLNISEDMKNYIKELITKDVEKADAVISAIEAGEPEMLKTALAIQRNSHPFFKSAETTGTKLYNCTNKNNDRSMQSRLDKKSITSLSSEVLQNLRFP
jgi:hypothetical protein